MHHLVKLTDAIRLLQLVISSPLVHALGDQSQAPNGIWTRVADNLPTIPPPLFYCLVTLSTYFLSLVRSPGPSVVLCVQYQ